MKQLKILLFTLLLLPLLAGAGEAAQTLTNIELKQEPFIDAQTIATLPAATAVEVITRQGGWMRIKPASGAEGWLKMSSIKLGSGTADAKGESGLGSLLNAARSGRSGNTGVTVATGVRGLSPEDLKNAKPAPEAVKKLDSFPNGKKEAESFASSGKLKSQAVEYLAEAKSVETAGGNSLVGGGRK